MGLEEGPKVTITRERFLQKAGAVVGGLAAGLGITSRVNAQEVPPPADPDNPNPPMAMEPDQSQVLSLTVDADGKPIPEASAGGETVANPDAPKRLYEGKMGILKVTNSLTTPTGELDAKRSVTVTSQEALDQVEALFAKKGLTGFPIDFNTFDYEKAYYDFRHQINPGVQPGGMRVCPTNSDPRCEIDFIHTVRKPEPQEKKTSAVFDVLDPNAKLNQVAIDYLNRTLNGVMADYGAEAIYGTRTALIADPKTKEEAEQLIKDVKAVAAFKFNFTPTTTTP